MARTICSQVNPDSRHRRGQPTHPSKRHSPLLGTANLSTSCVTMFRPTKHKIIPEVALRIELTSGLGPTGAFAEPLSWTTFWCDESPFIHSVTGDPRFSHTPAFSRFQPPWRYGITLTDFIRL